MTTSGIKPKNLTKAHLIQANIAEDYWDVDFSNYQGPIESSEITQSYLRNLKAYKSEGRGLLFAGKVGVGKTTLMVIVLKYLARANWNVSMTSLSELVETIKRSWDDKALSGVIDHCKSVDFLGIDDLGKEHQGPTGFSAVTFDNLLRYRVQHRYPTLFTTNLTRGEIQRRYGEATLSLIEGKTKIVPMQGADYRQEVQKHAIRQP